MKQGFANMLENLGEKSLGKVLSKVPQWKDTPGIEVPGQLCAQQCSSAATALCKTRVARGLAPEGKRIADLTGGLGVDSWFFSKVFEEVLYFERNKSLCEAAARNFERLGATGIRAINWEFGKDGAGIRELRDFRPDIIYLDPARRDGAGRKVFLLEDCEPDLLSLLPSLLDICPGILVKVSPMADISMLRSRLGNRLGEVRIVQSEGEVKELLLSIGEGAECQDTVLENLDTGAVMRLSQGEEQESGLLLSDVLPEAGSLVFEPGPGLMKAGAFRSVCSRFSARAMGLDTHLYVIEPEGIPGASLFGKVWKVLESVPMSGKTVREFGKRHPDADVTARGLHMTSEELSLRLGVKPGRGIHIFGIGYGPATERLKGLFAATRL